MTKKQSVIKILSREHGAKVIQWFKDQGLNTYGYTGECVGEYYGINFVGNVIRCSTIPEGYTEIQLPSELPKRGDKILVWDYSEKNAEEKIFLTLIEGAYNPIICVAADDEGKFLKNEVVRTVLWRHYKLIEPIKEVELTLDEIATKFGINVSQLKIKK